MLSGEFANVEGLALDLMIIIIWRNKTYRNIKMINQIRHLLTTAKWGLLITTLSLREGKILEGWSGLCGGVGTGAAWDGQDVGGGLGTRMPQDPGLGQHPAHSGDAECPNLSEERANLGQQRKTSWAKSGFFLGGGASCFTLFYYLTFHLLFDISHWPCHTTAFSYLERDNRKRKRQQIEKKLQYHMVSGRDQETSGLTFEFSDFIWCIIVNHFLFT